MRKNGISSYDSKEKESKVTLLEAGDLSICYLDIQTTTLSSAVVKKDWEGHVLSIVTPIRFEEGDLDFC